MHPSLQPHVGVLSLLGLLAVASSAAANDVDDAKALFKSGLVDMEAGRYEQGCKELADSQSLDPHPGTLYTLATCQFRWGHLKTAAARFGEYLEVYGRLTPDQQKLQGDRPKKAKEEQEKLAVEIPELTLSLPPGAMAGTVVKLNGEVVAVAALGAGQPMDPGAYVISTQAPGGPVWEQQITLGKGEKKQMVVEVKPLPAAEVKPLPVAEVKPLPAAEIQPPPKPSALPLQVPPPVVAGTSRQRKAAYVIGGIGIAGLALGGVAGGLTLGKKGLIGQHCGSGIKSKDETECDPVGVDAANSSRTLGLVSTIGFVTGLVELGTSAVLLLTGPKSTQPTGGKSRPWISAAVLSAGPGGAMVGARGAW